MSNKDLLDKLEEFIKDNSFGDVEGAILSWIEEQRNKLPKTKVISGYVEWDINYNYSFFYDPAYQRYRIPKYLTSQVKLLKNPSKVRIIVEAIE